MIEARPMTTNAPDAIPADVMELAKEAHADFARSSVKDNLTAIIARAIMADRARFPLAAPVAEGWRPIETAPRDGTDIILGAPAQQYQGKPIAPRSTVGHWTANDECRVQIGDYDCEPYWLSWDGGFTDENPATHWMPLPPAPGTVPKDPTDEMQNAARDWSIETIGHAVGYDGSRGCYQAMLAAAPTPPSTDSAQPILRAALTEMEGKADV